MNKTFVLFILILLFSTIILEAAVPSKIIFKDGREIIGELDNSTSSDSYPATNKLDSF